MQNLLSEPGMCMTSVCIGVCVCVHSCPYPVEQQSRAGAVSSAPAAWPPQTVGTDVW